MPVTSHTLSSEREELSLNDSASRLLMASMAPLAIGICLDVYLVARVIVQTQMVAATVAVSLLGVFLVFWLLLPRIERESRRRA